MFSVIFYSVVSNVIRIWNNCVEHKSFIEHCNSCEFVTPSLAGGLSLEFE